MTEIREISPRSSSELVTRQEAAELAGNYYELIRLQVASLGMSTMFVSETVTQDPANTYGEELVIAFPFPDPNAVAMLVAADDTRVEGLRPIFTVPTESGFPLMRDAQDNTFWCNFFYQKEGDTLQPIYTTEPIRVHGIIPQMQVADGRENGLEKIFPKNAELNSIAGSKWRTKKLFESAGLMVPRGFVVDGDGENIGNLITSIRDVAKLNPFGFVVKADRSSEGAHVKLFPQTDVRDAVEYGEFLLTDGHPSVIVEERILPYAISVGDDEKPIDYNFRVITSLGKYPKIVAAEVRASEMSYGPVNVARGADAYPAYKLLEYLPDEVLSSVYEAALIGSEVLREAVGGDGGSELLQLVGFDIIPSQDGKAYILEINPSGGGIGTLSKLAHGTPPDGIVTRFFPDTMPLLEENRDEKTAKGRSLQRLPLDSSGYEVAGYTLHDAREYERALLLLSDALDIFPGQTEYRKMVAQTYFSAGHYDRASEWFAVSEMYSPGDTRVNLLAATAAFLTGDLEDVQGILDEISTPKTFQDLIGIADIRALVEFHETNDLTRAVRVMQEQFPELLSEKEAEEEILHLSARFERLQSHKIELPRDPFNQSDRPIVVF